MRKWRLRSVAAAAGTLGLLLGAVGTASAAPEGPPPLGPDFQWGVAMSGFQSEGSFPDSNWTRYAADGGTPDPYNDSVDFYHRYPEDVRRAADLGVDTFRIGIEWARLQPEPDVWDEEAFAYYDDVLAEVRAAGMRPMLTLDHWVYPGWVADRGGWADPETVEHWLANMERVVDRYAPLDPLWVTFNEPFSYVQQELKHGGISPADVPGMLDGLVAAHRQIYDHIHAVQPGAMVTTNVAYIPAVEEVIDEQMLYRVADKIDYLGIDYYYGVSPENLTAVGALFDEHWTVELEPEGIYYALRHYADRFPELPLYIVENGMPTGDAAPRPDGQTRSEALRDTVYWIQRAKADGMDVIGYNYWSLADNYEWGSYAPRFGLYTV